MNICSRLIKGSLFLVLIFMPLSSNVSAQYVNMEIVQINMLLEAEILMGPPLLYNATGTCEISWSDPYINGSGFTVVDAEIIGLDLSGPGVEINMGGLPSPGQSVSEIPWGPDFPAESFFDVFFEIEFPADLPGEILHNVTGEHILGVVNDWPPLFDPYLDDLGTPPSLLENGIGDDFGYVRIVSAEILPYYPLDVRLTLDTAYGSDVLLPDGDLFIFSAGVSGPYDVEYAEFSMRPAETSEPWIPLGVDKWTFSPEGARYTIRVVVHAPSTGDDVDSVTVFIDPTNGIPEYIMWTPRDSIGFFKVDTTHTIKYKVDDEASVIVPAKIQVFPLAVDYKRDLTEVDQEKIGNTNAELDSSSCGPASAASCLKYFADNGHPALDNPAGNETKPEQTGEEMARELGVAMGTSAETGTTNKGMVAGIGAYLDSHGASGWTVKSEKVHGYAGIGAMCREFETDKEDVMMCIRQVDENGDTLSHFVTLGSKGAMPYEVQTPDYTALCVSYKLDFMDPSGGGSTEDNEYNVDHEDGKPVLNGYKLDEDSPHKAWVDGYVKVSPPDTSGGSKAPSGRSLDLESPGWIVVDSGTTNANGTIDSLFWDTTGFPGGLYLMEIVTDSPSGHECKSLALCGIPVYTVTGDDPGTPESPTNLIGSYPNPFNPVTTIEFSVARKTGVFMTIYDVSGKRIRRLVRGASYIPGIHKVKWNGINDRGEKVSSGVYFYRFEADGVVQTSKLVLMR